MFLRALVLIFGLLISVTMSMPELDHTVSECDSPCVTVTVSSASHAHATADSHPENCQDNHCPAHHSHCGHVNLLFQRSTSLVAFNDESRTFNDFSPQSLQEPDLEGPFQPPRA